MPTERGGELEQNAFGHLVPKPVPTGTGPVGE
jgi:hypothetical protein